MIWGQQNQEEVYSRHVHQNRVDFENEDSSTESEESAMAETKVFRRGLRFEYYGVQTIKPRADDLRKMFLNKNPEPQIVLCEVCDLSSEKISDIIYFLVVTMENVSETVLVDALIECLCLQRKPIDDLIKSFEATLEVESTPFKENFIEILKKYKTTPPFYFSLSMYGEMQKGDVEFCLKLENSPNVTDTLNLATPDQIRSALVFFASKKRSFHLSDSFEGYMLPLIQYARERGVDLDFCFDRSWSVFDFICENIPNDSCTQGQINVVDAFLVDEINPFKRVVVKAPHLIPTMNLEILKRFVKHPSSHVESYERDDFLKRCQEWYPLNFQWLKSEKGGEAANFWK